MSWVNAYVGIPYLARGRDHDGCDCWGLVRLVLAEQFGIQLPSYAGDYTHTGLADRVELARLIDARRPLLGAAEVAEPKAGDIALLRIAGEPFHVGVVTRPGWILHTERGCDSVHEAYTRPALVRRIEGFYRVDATC